MPNFIMQLVTTSLLKLFQIMMKKKQTTFHCEDYLYDFNNEICCKVNNKSFLIWKIYQICYIKRISDIWLESSNWNVKIHA